MKFVRVCIPYLIACGLPLAACGGAPVDEVDATESATKVQPQGEQYRYSVELVLAEAAEFPDALPMTAETALARVYKAVTIPGRATFESRAAMVETATTLRYGNETIVVFSELRKDKTSTKIPLYRLDVADPIVTRHADGSKYVVKGTFSVETEFDEIDGLATNRGLWLPAGDYTVNTVFTDENGEQQSDLRKLSLGK
jgi:hypothetical protein